jgi:hypothetical protein
VAALHLFEVFSRTLTLNYIYIYILINLCWSSTRQTNLAANFSYQSPRLKIKVARHKPASLSLLYIDAVKW